MTMKKMSEYKLKKITYWFILSSFILPVGFLIYRIVVTENVATGEIGYRSRADYTLMLVQCLLGAVVIHVPYFFRRYFKIEIPTQLYIMYIVFLYCAIFLGEVRSFYYRIPHWDKWLHGFSAVMAGTLGFILVDVLNKNNCGITLSPVFTAMFAFCFAVSIGVLWEIYEYAFDGILGLNMQKFMLEDSTQLVGREALNDTMKDIIIDVCGSLAAAIIGYLSIKRQQKNDTTKQSVVIDKHIEKMYY
mgnify:CR=1 FL=1